jgi:hypothetical protein
MSGHPLPPRLDPIHAHPRLLSEERTAPTMRTCTATPLGCDQGRRRRSQLRA